MILSRINVKNIEAANLQEGIFDLPEKVLQFGTGVLLRGLPDYFIDKANKQGIFNGRIVVVKSTNNDSTAFDIQDGLYTICVRGVENGTTIEENIINAAISRVIAANTDWQIVLDCAANPEMKIILSNTTEVGIQYHEEKISHETPNSFPAKLLSFLMERYKIFNGNAESGMVIVPTELITDNGTQLKNIVLQLAAYNNLDEAFINWLQQHNHFCNSLVDRIVPGKPNTLDMEALQQSLGYDDALLTMSEVFRLWAIEGSEKIEEVLSFAKVDAGVVIAEDITLFKELKLRLLNGTHTFNCGLAYLSGFEITRDAIRDEIFSKFAKKLMHNEIAKAIPFEIDNKIKTDFANDVFERFCNPYINHQWQSITTQYTSKMKMRNVPLLKKYYEIFNTVPMHMATGFAGYIYYMKAEKKEGNVFFGERNKVSYEITDESANYFYEQWQNNKAASVVENVLKNKALWGLDLTTFSNFCEVVQTQLQSMMENGVLETINNLVTNKAVVNEV
jgi:tagaturonate reductase